MFILFSCKFDKNLLVKQLLQVIIRNSACWCFLHASFLLPNFSLMVLCLVPCFVRYAYSIRKQLLIFNILHLVATVLLMWTPSLSACTTRIYLPVVSSILHVFPY